MSSPDQLNAVLSDANAWVAFNVPQSAIPSLSDAALSSGVKRAVFTVELPDSRINDTVIPEFVVAKEKFAVSGAAFTGIRHPKIIDGNEDNPYEIVNASIPCLESTVERGVLARVVAELLRLQSSFNEECGVSSSGAFAAAYLNILRSSGLTRQQEVMKMFSGGLQRVAKLTVDEYEAEQRRKDEARAAAERRKQEAAIEAVKEKERDALAIAQSQALQRRSGAEEEFELIEDPTLEERIVRRTDDILRGVWREMESRLYSKSTTKQEFFDANREKARALAEKEFDEERSRRLEILQEKRSKQVLLDKLVEANRKQYSKLIALERKELQNQKEISDVWVRYIFMLLESTIEDCNSRGILFHNQDEFAQTMLLRSQANALREKCNLPPYDVVYDPLDASVIVARLGKTFPGMLDSADEMAALLESKHGNTLINVPVNELLSRIISLNFVRLFVAPSRSSRLRWRLSSWHCRLLRPQSTRSGRARAPRGSSW